jgi:hypothetical protein
MGAQASGAPKMEFGVNAYTTNIQPAAGTTTTAATIPSPPLATPTLFCMGSCPAPSTIPATAVSPVQTTTATTAQTATMQSMMQSLFQQIMQFLQSFFSFF